MSPYCGPAGWSEHTPQKQAIFKVLAETLIVATRNHRKSWAHPEFVYFDLNGGPGVYEDGSLGSPVIALDAARRLGEPVRAFVYERDDERRDGEGGLIDVLRSRGLQAETRRDHTGAPADARTVARAASRPLYGLVYCDPNPCKDLMPSATLAEIVALDKFQRVEVLVYMSATVYGRLRSSEGRFLLDDLAAIPKRFTYLRHPVGQHRWTFALLTNWKRDAAWLKRYRFELLGTPEGNALALDLNLTRKELIAHREGDLFAEAS